MVALTKDCIKFARDTCAAKQEHCYIPARIKENISMCDVSRNIDLHSHALESYIMQANIAYIAVKLWSS